LGEEIERIKAQPGRYAIAYGGAGFARALVRRGLVDEYRLNIQPCFAWKAARHQPSTWANRRDFDVVLLGWEPESEERVPRRQPASRSR
jgi:hypothetical protein